MATVGSPLANARSIATGSRQLIATPSTRMVGATLVSVNPFAGRSLLNGCSMVHRAAVWAAGSALLLAMLFFSVARAEKIEQLKPQGYVNDFAGVLSEGAREQITALCRELDQRAHAQVAVVTVRSLDDVPVEDFANKLYERWGIGYRGENRGVLILLAVNDRKYRVEVGYGLEPILPDGKVGGFGREMVPRLRQGDYNAALLGLTVSIVRVIATDRGVELSNVPRQEEPERRSRPAPNLPALMIIILAFVAFGGLGVLFLLLPIIAATGGRRRGGWGAGPWIGMGGGGGGNWGGGGFGGGSSGGGGFGGFGGGSSGGGGASGSW